MLKSKRLPSWFYQPLPDASRLRALKSSFDNLGIHTVCQSSRCPNLGRCWEKGVATFMILGEVCTRACRFCAVRTGIPSAVNSKEPRSVAKAVRELGLDYVVITSVTRDDLRDRGAEQFSKTIRAVRALNPGIRIEVLIPDLGGEQELLKIIVQAVPDVLAHNLETVRRLAPQLRPQANYDRSLSVLKAVKEFDPGIVTKSGLMLGLGEMPQDVKEAMRDLYSCGCDILTIGQYLAPTKTKRHFAVKKFSSLNEFEDYRQKALTIGFKHVLSAPLVRSSYLAKEAYEACRGQADHYLSEKVYS